MYVGALRAEFRLPGARSLKEKRKPLRSLKDRLRNRFQVSVSEVDSHDVHQRVVIGIATVAESAGSLHRQLATIRRYLEGDSTLQLVNIQERTIDRIDEEFEMSPADLELSGKDDNDEDGSRDLPDNLIFLNLDQKDN